MRKSRARLCACGTEKYMAAGRKGAPPVKKLGKLLAGSRFWACVLALVLAASLVPLLAVAQYSHPSADDYPYAVETHAAWQETGSIWAVLRAAGHTVAQRYQTWQGSFSAIFLFALQPAIFGEGLYGLGTVFLLGAALAAVAAAAAALHKVTGAPLSACAVLGLLYALVCIQLLPSPAQGYYWWNGASYYWLFFFGLLALGALLARLLGPGLSGPGTLGAALLAAVLGGGNYITALQMCEVLALTVLASALWRRAAVKRALAVALCGFAAFAVNAAAPGNAVRAATTATQGKGAVWAVVQSFPMSVHYARVFTTPVLLAALAFAVPFLVRAVRGAAPGFRYPYPLAVLAGLYCFYASSFTPTLFVYGTNDEKRVKDIQFCLWVLVCLAALWYVLGWALRRLGPARAGGLRRLALPYLAGAVLFSALAFVPQVRGGQWSGTACVSAVYYLRSGVAQAYDEAVYERLDMLAGEEMDIVFPMLPPEPWICFHEDLAHETYNWKNEAFAEYYGKRTVAVAAPE